jgi:hypothetical protein
MPIRVILQFKANVELQAGLIALAKRDADVF